MLRLDDLTFILSEDEQLLISHCLRVARDSFLNDARWLREGSHDGGSERRLADQFEYQAKQANDLAIAFEVSQ